MDKKDRPTRKTNRIPHYNYSSNGFYFITICSQNMECLFGKAEQGELQLNTAGKMIESQWLKLPGRFDFIQFHEFVVMPNHFHGLIEIVGEPLAGSGDNANIGHCDNKRIGQQYRHLKRPQGIVPTVSEIVGAFKSQTTNEYIKLVKQFLLPPFNKRVWQRSFHDHIVRNEESLLIIKEYIENNPAKWSLDRYYKQYL